MKSGLASLLVGGGLDPDFVIRHDLLHDLTKGSRLAIFACGRKVDRRQSERLGRLGGVRCETRAGSRSPSRGNRSGNGTWRGNEGWKCLWRVSIGGSKALTVRGWGRGGLRRERVWGTFELV